MPAQHHRRAHRLDPRIRPSPGVLTVEAPTHQAGRTVLILGGGVGGVVAATILRKRLPTEHRVVLVDRAARPPLRSLAALARHRAANIPSRHPAPLPARPQGHRGGPRRRQTDRSRDSHQSEWSVPAGGVTSPPTTSWSPWGPTSPRRSCPGWQPPGTASTHWLGLRALREAVERFTGGRSWSSPLPPPTNAPPHPTRPPC